MLLQKIKAWLVLQESKALKMPQILQLIETLGDPIEYIGIKSDKWDKVDFLSAQQIDYLQKDHTIVNWEKIKKLVKEHNIHFITILDDEYPDELKNIYHFPLFLFAMGDLDILQKEKKGGIVGTRKPSAYGRICTKKICEQLCFADFVIVSGLATGIDAEAHHAALDYNGKTIAVLAHGLDIIYPPQNRELAKQISKKGLLITEYIPFSKMSKWNFIQRNRIISGLSQFVAIMEGKAKSGAMLTANFALEQGRDIFALPGNITIDSAEGPNTLIQNGANCISSANTINDYYQEKFEPRITTREVNLEPEEEFIYKIIKDNPPHIHADDLITITNYDFGRLSNAIFMLELKDLVKKIEGNRYICCN
ncbi:MAG TPA: DNA-processing protein DprA [Candidatus Cloacimonadota bacterium]|jgi:DNA processing protein|nr:DNA-processing protein DprA [Candidatus Cloacimonadales bacterium]HPY96495.1 DNA-processing protein DprA [Candidatus Cloacimonadota bacterium]HQB41529.1 DNA-processing protein DprA [Candidatus Cloacimonadota bacterium]